MFNKHKQNKQGIERLTKGLPKKLIHYKKLTGKTKDATAHKSWSKRDMDEKEIGQIALEQWKVCAQIAQNTSQRRATASTVYMALNTAIIGSMYSQGGESTLWTFLGIHKEAKQVIEPTILPIIGIIICLGWISSILYYKELNKVRYNIIKELEDYIEIKPFQCESYATLNQSGSWQNELYIPKMFIWGYVIYAVWIVVLAVMEKFKIQWIKYVLENNVITSVAVVIVIGIIIARYREIIMNKDEN